MILGSVTQPLPVEKKHAPEKDISPVGLALLRLKRSHEVLVKLTLCLKDSLGPALSGLKTEAARTTDEPVADAGVSPLVRALNQEADALDEIAGMLNDILIRVEV